MNFLNEKAEKKRFSDMKSYIEFLMTDMIKFEINQPFHMSAFSHVGLFTCQPYITSHANDFQD